MINRAPSNPAELMQRSKRVLDLFAQQTEAGLLVFYAPQEVEERIDTEHYFPLDGSITEKVTKWLPLDKILAAEIYSQFNNERHPFKSLALYDQVKLVFELYTAQLTPIFNSNPANYYKNYAFSFFNETADTLLQSYQELSKVFHELGQDINKMIDQQNQNQACLSR